MSYLIFVPLLEVLCILDGDLLVFGPHLLHDLGQILTFRSVHIHLHAPVGNLAPHFHQILQGAEEEDTSGLSLYRVHRG